MAGSCGDPVVVVQAAEDRVGGYAVGRDRFRRASRAIEGGGAALADALVGPTSVEVAAVLVENPLKVVFVEDEDVIQTLATHGATADRLTPRRRKGREEAHPRPEPGAEGLEQLFPLG